MCTSYLCVIQNSNLVKIVHTSNSFVKPTSNTVCVYLYTLSFPPRDSAVYFPASEPLSGVHQLVDLELSTVATVPRWMWRMQRSHCAMVTLYTTMQSHWQILKVKTYCSEFIHKLCQRLTYHTTLSRIKRNWYWNRTGRVLFLMLDAHGTGCVRKTRMASVAIRGKQLFKYKGHGQGHNVIDLSVICKGFIN